MASVNPKRGNDDAEQTGGDQETKKETSKDDSIQKTLALLKARDDTSRFAGLTVLKAILDINEDLQKDSNALAQFWVAISAKFLDRLLGAGANEKKSKHEAESMAELAVGVLHAFVRLITSIVQEHEKLLGRAEGLMAALAWSPIESITQNFQILITLASTPKGSLALLDTKSWPQLLKVVSEHTLAMDVVKYTFLTAAPRSFEQSLFWDKLDGTVSTLVISFGNARDLTLLFEGLNQILTALPARDNAQSPRWLVPIVELIRNATLSCQGASAAKSRQALVLFTATLFHLYPSETSTLIFNGAGKQGSSSGSKPLAYLFVKLLLIDIRSSVPSLLVILNSPEYPNTSARLAGSYDIVSSFIGFLVQSLDEEGEDNAVTPSAPFPFSPSELLQLRVDTSEVMSLTIETLRDRFDASVAGAAGLDKSARLHSAGPSNPSLAISWESSEISMAEDLLTLSQLRALALWLREDENDALRKEAAGIMDVLLFLYGTKCALDFRSPVLIALEGISTVPEGVEAFLRTEGWELLVEDLRQLIASPTLDSSHGTDIVRVLLQIVEADETGPAKEEWMQVVQLASVTKPSEQWSLDKLALEVAQLAVEIIIQSPPGVRKQNQKAVTDLAKWSIDMSRPGFPAITTDEARAELQDIVQILEDLTVDGV